MHPIVDIKILNPNRIVINIILWNKIDYNSLPLSCDGMVLIVMGSDNSLSPKS